MKKTNRGFGGYVVMLVTFLVIAILLNNALGGTENKRIEYPELLTMVQDDTLEAVAIRGTSLVGLKRGSTTLRASFPENDYDFETTIGDDFLLTVRQIVAAKRGVDVEEVAVSDLPFSVAYRAPVTIPWWYEFLPFVIMLVVLGLFWYFMMRAQTGGNKNVMSFGKSHAKVQDPAKNKVTFADVAGADEEKEELQEMVDFLRNPRAYTELGARIPKGVLLVGPPGTGKTLLAKAVAGEAGVPFFSISGSDFVEMFVGVGASRVRDLFDQAKKNAPAIVFIDEIDAVGRHRGAGLGGGHDEREQTLNQLLVEMDGFEVNQGVIVMAATNRRDILDPALLRPGRFDRQVTVNYPDLEGRIAILKVHSRGKPLAADVDLNNVAKRVPFATGAELENIMNEAAILAARARKTEIDQQLLIDAIARVQMGPEKRSHKVNEEDRRMVAYHEGGHAIVGHLLKHCDEVHLITIVPRGQSAGHTLSLPAQEHDNMSRSQILDMVSMALGGRAAEEVVMGEVYTGAVSDLQRATELCRKMVTQFGMSEKLGTIYLGSDQEVFVGMEFGQSREYSEQVAAEIDAEVHRLLEECYDRARTILRENRDKLELLVEYLLKMDTVNRAEFLSLMETGTIPEGLSGDKPRPAADIPAPEQPEEHPEKNDTPDGVDDTSATGASGEEPHDPA